MLLKKDILQKVVKPKFFDKITEDMDWHLLTYFQEVLTIYPGCKPC